MSKERTQEQEEGLWGNTTTPALGEDNTDCEKQRK